MEAWEKKRKTTTRVFIFQNFLLGIEYSITFLTLWIYIKTLVNTTNPKLFYSIVSSCYLLSAIIFSTIIGRWADKTRSVRMVFLISNSFPIVGNVIYVLHFSPWFLVVGRFLCGIAASLRSVIIGEVVRCFPSEVSPSKISVPTLKSAIFTYLG